MFLVIGPTFESDNPLRRTESFRNNIKTNNDN